VGDEEKPHVFLCHEVLEQLEDLRLRGDVERGGGLIGDQEPRVQRDGRGDADALPLAAGQLMGIGVEPDMGQADAVRRSRAMASASPRSACPWMVSVSATWSPMVCTGLSAVIGSWKIIAMSLPRVAHQSASGWSRRLLAVETDVPGGGRAVGQETHQRKRRHGLARAAFADKAEDLALRDVERDVRAGWGFGKW
jgi:hypothetical protein